MKKGLFWAIWFTGIALFVGDWLIPISTVLTRSAGIALLTTIWVGLLLLVWRWRLPRIVLLLLTGLAAVFLALPGRIHQDGSALREAYVGGLLRYNGTAYYWGGESPSGIDCSGLVRRGLIDSLFCQGLRTFDPSLVRYAISLWWHDSTAREMGEGRRFTTRLFETTRVDSLDLSTILPGDLAVTAGTGIHVLAYLGNNRWIEADPDLGRVVTVSLPSEANHWFRGPMNVVRWKILER